jgi:hypothetical protein
MTAAIHIRSQVLVLMVGALVAATLVSQFVVSMIVQALGESQSLRVAPSTACSVNGDGAYFTGCSSIL